MKSRKMSTWKLRAMIQVKEVLQQNQQSILETNIVYESSIGYTSEEDSLGDNNSCKEDCINLIQELFRDKEMLTVEIKMKQDFIIEYVEQIEQSIVLFCDRMEKMKKTIEKLQSSNEK